MQNLTYKDVSFDFAPIAFGRLRGKFEEGISHSEYFRLSGALFRLTKKEAKRLLSVLATRYPLVEGRKGIALRRDANV